LQSPPERTEGEIAAFPAEDASNGVLGNVQLLLARILDEIPMHGVRVIEDDFGVVRSLETAGLAQMS